MDDKRERLRMKIEKFKKSRNLRKKVEVRNTLQYNTPEPLTSARTHYKPDGSNMPDESRRSGVPKLDFKITRGKEIISSDYR